MVRPSCLHERRLHTPAAPPEEQQLEAGLLFPPLILVTHAKDCALRELLMGHMLLVIVATTGIADIRAVLILYHRSVN